MPAWSLVLIFMAVFSLPLDYEQARIAGARPALTLDLIFIG
jgi:hypothetical protein